MGRKCEVSGKKTSFGNHITTRGKAKYLGGVGTKCTGVSRRVFKPNLQRIHVWLPNGTTRYVRVATSVMRTQEAGSSRSTISVVEGAFPLIKASKEHAKSAAARASRTSIRSERPATLDRSATSARNDSRQAREHKHER